MVKNEFNIKDIKTGDAFLTTDYSSFISKAIRYVMTAWGKKKGYDTQTVLSHAGTFVWIADELYVYGSVESGFKPWLFRYHYSLIDPNEGVIIMRRKEPLTDKEEKQITNYNQHLTTVSIGYQYWNFIQWLVLVYLGINMFKVDSDNFTYCFESQLLCRKNLNPDRYGETWMTDYFMLVNDPYYDIIYKNVK